MRRGGIGRCEGIKAGGWWLVAGGWGAPDGAGSRIEDRDRRSGGRLTAQQLVAGAIAYARK